MTTPTLAGVYARISKDDGLAFGVTRQVKDGTELADRNNWTVVTKYIDNDVSARISRGVPQRRQERCRLRQSWTRPDRGTPF